MNPPAPLRALPAVQRAQLHHPAPFPTPLPWSVLVPGGQQKRATSVLDVVQDILLPAATYSVEGMRNLYISGFVVGKGETKRRNRQGENHQRGLPRFWAATRTRPPNDGLACDQMRAEGRKTPALSQRDEARCPNARRRRRNAKQERVFQCDAGQVGRASASNEERH